MLKHPQHRVGDAVDIGQKRFGDDRNSHTVTVSSAGFAKVAYEKTSCVELLS
jgi:hypothetical protein